MQLPSYEEDDILYCGGIFIAIFIYIYIFFFQRHDQYIRIVTERLVVSIVVEVHTQSVKILEKY